MDWKNELQAVIDRLDELVAAAGYVVAFHRKTEKGYLIVYKLPYTPLGEWPSRI